MIAHVMPAFEEGRELICLYELIFETLFDAKVIQAVLDLVKLEKRYGHGNYQPCS